MLPSWKQALSRTLLRTAIAW